MEINIIQEILEAEKRIRPYIYETPLDYSPLLSSIGQCSVYLKMENQQKSGSFKFRGASNLILSLDPKEQEKGFITASTGNHARAVAGIASTLKLQGTIVLPENAAPSKIEALRRYSSFIRLELHGQDCVVTEAYARRLAQKTGRTYIPPYNHPKIIGGQGTIGIELLRNNCAFDCALIPVGGGGLASGVAGYLKTLRPNVEIIGCQPVNSPVMAESIKKGYIIDFPSKPTLAGGTAGGIEPGSITFDLCKTYVDDFILVSEEEIADAIHWMEEQSSITIEGAAALTVASFFKQVNRFAGKKIILLITGRKIDPQELKD